MTRERLGPQQVCTNPLLLFYTTGVVRQAGDEFQRPTEVRPLRARLSLTLWCETALFWSRVVVPIAD